MDFGNAQNARPPRVRNEKGRRCWSKQEEEALIVGLKEIIVTGWKSENGFRLGYLNALETFMAKAFPGTDLKGNPHINSKIHGWKKSHGSLFSMLAKSGIGYNHTTKMIDASQEAWDEYVRVDPPAKVMRFKSWPYYEDWCEIFGKDRAIGENSESFVDVVNIVLNGPTIELSQDDDFVFENFNSTYDGFGKTGEIGHEGPSPNSGTSKRKAAWQPVVTETQPTSSVSGKSKTTRKRKAVDNSDTVCDLLGKFYENTNARLGDIAKRIGYEYDISVARKEVWTFVDAMDGMNLNEKLLVSKLLVKSTEDLELFFSLPQHAKEEFTKMKLAGHL